MSTFRDLPRAARRLIAAYSALAAVAVLVRVPEIRTWTWEDAVATAALALAAGLSEQFTVAVAHRTETEDFSVLASFPRGSYHHSITARRAAWFWRSPKGGRWIIVMPPGS